MASIDNVEQDHLSIRVTSDGPPHRPTQSRQGRSLAGMMFRRRPVVPTPHVCRTFTTLARVARCRHHDARREIMTGQGVSAFTRNRRRWRASCGRPPPFRGTNHSLPVLRCDLPQQCGYLP